MDGYGAAGRGRALTPLGLLADGSATFAGTIAAGALVLEGTRGTMVHDHSNVTAATMTVASSQDLMTRTLPTLSDGDMIDFVAIGTTAATATTKTVQMRLGNTVIASLVITQASEAWALRGHLIKDGLTTWVIVVPRGGVGGAFTTVVSTNVDLSGAAFKVHALTGGIGGITAEAFVTTATNKGA